MKTVRIIIIVIIAALVLSVWTPITASAKARDNQAILVKGLNGSLDIPKVAYVNIENKTGGILYVELKADVYGRGKNAQVGRSYLFGFPNQGEIRFQILPGRYTYTIRSSNCGGKRLNTRFFTLETNLGRYYCDK